MATIDTEINLQAYYSIKRALPQRAHLQIFRKYPIIGLLMGATGGFSDGRGSFPDRGHQESTQGITEWHPQRDPLAPKRKGCRFWPRRKPRNPQEPQGPRDYTELYREHGLIPRG